MYLLSKKCCLSCYLHQRLFFPLDIIFFFLFKQRSLLLIPGNDSRFVWWSSVLSLFPFFFFVLPNWMMRDECPAIFLLHFLELYLCMYAPDWHVFFFFFLAKKKQVNDARIWRTKGNTKGNNLTELYVCMYEGSAFFFFTLITLTGKKKKMEGRPQNDDVNQLILIVSDTDTVTVTDTINSEAFFFTSFILSYLIGMIIIFTTYIYYMRIIYIDRLW